MNHTPSHILPEHLLPEQDEAFFQAAVLPLFPEKKAVWESLSQRIDFQESSAPVAKVRKLSFLKYAAAAVVVLVVGAALWASTYSQTVRSLSEQQIVALPDGSSVQLNGQSSLSFHPYWWFMSREMHFEGEAYFQVEKGSDFAVISEAGTTTVLGTSFSIDTRNNNYKVFCETGKVRVHNPSGEVVLLPGDMALLQENNEFKTLEGVEAKEVLYWSDSKFYFENLALSEVLSALERQYGVSIKTQGKGMKGMRYTGFFSKPNSVEEALEVVSLSLGLTFEKVENGNYKVATVK